jgi:CBS domain containing-hemolysin-like protein
MNTDWLLVIITLLFSGFFSGLEIAFVSSNRLKQELDIKNNIPAAKILSLFYKNPSRFIGALLLGNNIASVGYGIVMAHILEPVVKSWLPVSWQSEFVILLIQTILSTLLILITAEFIPKILFRINPNGILKFFSIPVWFFYVIFYPLILLYIGFSEYILKKIFRIEITNEKYNFSAIDLDEYINDFQQSEEEQNTEEIQMLQNAIEFKYVKLRDCMIPRTEIVATDINCDINILIKLFSESGHSKIMIYDGDIDNIVGYVHAYDMFIKPKSIKQILRKVDVYPETMGARELLKDFIKNHKSIAVIVDEFGGTSGIVTLEDIIEEIFGEIEDEYDTVEGVEKRINDNEYIFSARLEIDYLNKKYKLNIPVKEEYETLAGFILFNHGSIPEKGEIIVIEPYTFEVIEATGNKIEEVKMTINTSHE